MKTHDEEHDGGDDNSARARHALGSPADDEDQEYWPLRHQTHQPHRQDQLSDC